MYPNTIRDINNEMYTHVQVYMHQTGTFFMYIIRQWILHYNRCEKHINTCTHTKHLTKPSQGLNQLDVATTRGYYTTEGFFFSTLFNLYLLLLFWSFNFPILIFADCVCSMWESKTEGGKRMRLNVVWFVLLQLEPALMFYVIIQCIRLCFTSVWIMNREKLNIKI